MRTVATDAMRTVWLNAESDAQYLDLMVVRTAGKDGKI
jgi:hypothetical protein